MSAGPHFRGSNASGLARAVVDATGRMIDVELDSELLRRPAALVAEAVLAAVLDAQDKAAQDRAMLDAEDRPAVEGLKEAVEQANLEAERRLSQFATLVSDLARATEFRR